MGFLTQRLMGSVVVMLTFILMGCNTQLQKPPVDFSGFWELGEDFTEVIRPELDQDNLTEEAKQRLAEFRQRFPEGQATWPADLCLFHGMPWTMLTRARTYVTEIVQTPDRIFMKSDGMDLFRDIHLDQDAIPAGYGPSNQGYSIGRWEGDELVIETGGLIALNDYIERPRSGDARITERWRLVTTAGGEELWEVELWVDDPAVFRKPGYGRKRFRRMAEGAVVGGYNCNNALWDDYVDRELTRQEQHEQGE